MCILFVCMLSKVVSHSDFSVLSMSVVDFKENVDSGVGGLGELYSVFFL